MLTYSNKIIKKVYQKNSLFFNIFVFCINPPLSEKMDTDSRLFYHV